MSKQSRDKGARGQSEAARLLKDRDWAVDPLTCGVKREDLLATAPDGRIYCVEVKNCVLITSMHRTQAMKQAKERKLLWMLMSKISGTSSWLIQRQGQCPVIWSVKEVL